MYLLIFVIFFSFFGLFFRPAGVVFLLPWAAKRDLTPIETPPPNSPQPKSRSPSGRTQQQKDHTSRPSFFLPPKGCFYFFLFIRRVFLFQPRDKSVSLHPLNVGCFVPHFIECRPRQHDPTIAKTAVFFIRHPLFRNAPCDSQPPVFFITPYHDLPSIETPPSPERVPGAAPPAPREWSLPPACPADGCQAL